MSGPTPRLVEVGPRDGLQNEKFVAPLDAKVAYVDALSGSGLREIEVGAFVSPKVVPQMADSERVFARIARRPGVVYSALVPNEKGFERALAAKAGKVAVFTAASETFNLKNINASIAESIERFKPVIVLAQKERLPVRAYVSTAFYCPYEGAVAPEAVVSVVRRLLDLSVTEISIGDTIGKAQTEDVKRLLSPLLDVVATESVFLHFHDTYGHAVENALTAWREFGVSGFDASTGGVGGCPYAPGASGNVATEALVCAFKAAGSDPGVDEAKLKAAAAGLFTHLGRPGGARPAK
ncbi:MAG: hydroxymethylglutaryl-CoA lyase [Elusimicrobia bacterium GWA2_66_18]|nr:MAG: hydroxymethylglutaryl-CoA lyase [Elusimicrobia bacterium GWA2_66_18]